MGNKVTYCTTNSQDVQSIDEPPEKSTMLNVPSTSNGLTAKPAIGRSEYGRVKVALPRGKGLMDWVLLTKDKMLARKQMKWVDHEELSKHNTQDDCWIHIFGQVYDVTSYLEFHPGGIPELMRASGRDGTALFNQYHAWVNYENMLKSCFVGHFKGDLTKLKPCDPPTTFNNDATKNGDETIRGNTMVLTMFDRLIIANPEWKDISTDCLVVSRTKNSLRLLIRPYGKETIQAEWIGVPRPIAEASYKIEISGEQIILAFDISISIKVLESPGLYRFDRKPMLRYHKATISSIRELNHDILLINVQLADGISMPIPIGHHNSIGIRKGAATLYREYTPTSSDGKTLQFMIKIYQDGLCTPSIRLWKEGDEISISDPIGDWDLNEWTKGDELVVLAAGSGWTPMIGVIEKALKEDQMKGISLFYFNKTEADIVDDSWMPFRWNNDRIKVNHVLSRPSAEWKGSTGRITTELLEEVSKSRQSQKVLVCGPDGFIQTATEILMDLDYTVKQVHIFQG
ncbi:unnamed protein product, partial [Mesorhabditis belari]|uniref:Cytochrome-b5 reductase n=1 Tax=Mesorhabditis belari TaxID=2138241 RepID=A0AAF3EDC0_9BILA